MTKKKKKKTTKEKEPIWWWCETWKMNFYFFIAWKDGEFKSYLEKHHPNACTNMNGCAGRTYEEISDDARRMLIYIRDKGAYPELAHECVHAAKWTLEGAGADLRCDESIAYLTEALFRKAIGQR